MMTRTPALELIHISRYMGKGKFPAVRDVSLTVDRGSIHALLGPNGAGKTTTVKVAAGILTPSAGSVCVAGINILKCPREAREHIGLMLGGELGFTPEPA